MKRGWDIVQLQEDQSIWKFENFGSLSIRTDGKDLSETKTDDEQICFGFLCYFTSIK